MKAYLLSTGLMFAGVTVVHAWRAVMEPHLASHAWYILLTGATGLLAIWAWRLWRRLARS